MKTTACLQDMHFIYAYIFISTNIGYAHLRELLDIYHHAAMYLNTAHQRRTRLPPRYDSTSAFISVLDIFDGIPS